MDLYSQSLYFPKDYDSLLLNVFCFSFEVFVYSCGLSCFCGRSHVEFYGRASRDVRIVGA